MQQLDCANSVTVNGAESWIIMASSFLVDAVSFTTQKCHWKGMSTSPKERNGKSYWPFYLQLPRGIKIVNSKLTPREMDYLAQDIQLFLWLQFMYWTNGLQFTRFVMRHEKWKLSHSLSSLYKVFLFKYFSSFQC